jgi:acyl-CoA synthetase (AMP-forming)/AMP-acid ligase II
VLRCNVACVNRLCLNAPEPRRELRMQGLMQRHELLISSILEHAARHHGDAELVSRRPDGSLARTNYAALALRARKLATVLRDLGVVAGDRVGTLAMNSDRHMELYYGISGIGAVCNTINPRLSHDDIAYIAGHAEDGVIFCDPQFLPIAASIAPKLDCLRAVVVLLADAKTMAETLTSVQFPDRVALHCHETLIERAEPIGRWPEFDENTASGLS